MAVKRVFVDVLYTDGRQVSYPVRPVALVASERHFASIENTGEVEATVWAAWWGIQGPKPAFKEWMESLDAAEARREAIDASTDEEAAAPLEAASAPASSTSPPEAE